MRKISFSFLSVYIQHGNEEKYSFLDENQLTSLKNVKKFAWFRNVLCKTLFYDLSWLYCLFCVLLCSEHLCLLQRPHNVEYRVLGVKNVKKFAWFRNVLCKTLFYDLSWLYCLFCVLLCSEHLCLLQGLHNTLWIPGIGLHLHFFMQYILVLWCTPLQV